MPSEAFMQHYELAEEKLAAAELIRVINASPSNDWGKLIGEAQVHATLALAAASLPRRKPSPAVPFVGVGPLVEHTNAKTGNRKFTDWSGHVVAEADDAGYFDGDNIYTEGK